MSKEGARMFKPWGEVFNPAIGRMLQDPYGTIGSHNSPTQGLFATEINREDLEAVVIRKQHRIVDLSSNPNGVRILTIWSNDETRGCVAMAVQMPRGDIWIPDFSYDAFNKAFLDNREK